MRPGLWWNWLLRRVFNYLQSFRRGVWCNSFGGDVDRSAIDSLHTERPDPCNYFLVPSERLRYVRQAKALLSIISFILRKKKKELRECIKVKDFLNRLCVIWCTIEREKYGRCMFAVSFALTCHSVYPKAS